MTDRAAWSRPSLALLLAMLLSLTGVLTAPASASDATPRDTKGKDFWLAIPKARQISQTTMSLAITASTATSGTVAVPGLSWSADFTVSPPAATVVTLPNGAMLGDGTSGDPQALGIHVTAADDVSVSARFSNAATSEVFLALPTDALTTEHLALAWTAPGLDPSSMFSEFAVLATEDGTAVTITTRAGTTSGKAVGETWTVNLAKGDVLPVVSRTGDVSGSVISATAPVAVFGGHSCANVPNLQTGFCDYLVEQIPGSDTWGTSFLTVPLSPRAGDTFRMLAAEDATTISVDGAPVATLDRGEFHEQILSAASSITANRPILVAQYANGFQYDRTIGDPAMLVVPAIDQFLDTYSFAVPEGYQSNSINVIAPDAAVGAVKLDGADIPAGSFAQVGTSGFSAAQLEVTAGGHVVTSPQPVGVAVYGFTGTGNFTLNEGYGFPAGFGLGSGAFAKGLTMTPKNQTVQVNSQACVTADVTDRDGLGLAGVPITFQVTGANPRQGSGLTKGDGQSVFCYTGTATGTDTVSAGLGTATATTATATQGLSATATVVWEAAPTPPPVPPVTPTRLPINVKGAKTSPVRLGADGKAVLARAISTNRYGTTAIRHRCRPVAPSVAGDVRFCDVTVSKKGKVTVRSTGFGAVKVTVVVRATPRNGESGWRASTQRNTWVVRP